MSPRYIFAALAALAGGAACTENDESMVILKNSVPQEGCALEASDQGQFQSSGRIHPQSQVGYIFTPVVRSLITEKAGVDRLIFMRGADITVEDVAGAELAQFGVRFSGTIAPGGLGAFGFEVLPPNLIAGIGEALVSARVQVYGDFAGGEVRSDEFIYPIQICADCFYDVLGLCSELEDNYQGVIDGSACNPLQDGTVECCDDGTGKLVCPAVGPEPPEEGA